MTDARIVRTRAALHRSILQLASEQAAPAISVSALAANAGINRVTFYKHYITPAETLSVALVEDYEPRPGSSSPAAPSIGTAAHSTSADTAQALFHLTLGRILNHVDRHPELFRLSLASQEDGTAAGFLSARFTELIDDLRRLAQQQAGNGHSVAVETRFLALGLVGAVTAWALGECPDRETLVQTAQQLFPATLLPRNSELRG